MPVSWVPDFVSWLGASFGQAFWLWATVAIVVTGLIELLWQKRLSLRVTLGVLIACVVLGFFLAWDREHQLRIADDAKLTSSAIHITRTTVAFVPTGKYVQIVINEYAQNDESIALTHLMTFKLFALALSTADVKTQVANAKKLRDVIEAAKTKRAGPEFSVPAHGQFWFTPVSAMMTIPQFNNFARGKYMLYFAGSIAPKDKPPVDFCGMNQGNPNVTFDCPESST